MSTGRKKSTGSQGDLFKFDKIGQKLKGYYLGSQQVSGEYGPATKHVFKTDGGVKTVFGSKGLNEIFADETPGVLVEVEYTHDIVSKKKGRAPMKMYDASFFDDDALDLREIDTGLTATESEEPDYSEEEDAEEGDTVAADEVRTALARKLPAATAPTAAQRQRVQDLLNKRKTA